MNSMESLLTNFPLNPSTGALNHGKWQLPLICLTSYHWSTSPLLCFLGLLLTRRQSLCQSSFLSLESLKSLLGWFRAKLTLFMLLICVNNALCHFVIIYHSYHLPFLVEISIVFWLVDIGTITSLLRHDILTKIRTSLPSYGLHLLFTLNVAI